MKKLILTAWMGITALAGFTQTQNPPVKVPETLQPKTINKKQPANNLGTTPTPINRGEISIRERRTITPAYNFSKVHICVDKDKNPNLPAKPTYVKPALPPKINSDGSVDYTSSVSQGLTGVTNNMWNPGDVVAVGFAVSETTPFVINKVKQFARMWETIANIKFDFVDLSQAKIRIGFDTTGRTSWSWVGRDVVTNTFNQKTMNFGWFDNNTSDTEFRRVVLHEFGHALGFIHEHQASTANISWDTEKVYAFFGGPPNNWDRAAVDRNIFAKYSASSTNSSVYDNNSIMHYFFSSDLTTNGVAMPGNNNFSTIDKQFSRQVYPFPPTPTNATGTLRTGDDCDEIDFVVEYGVVNSDVIEFVLQPGRDQNGQILTWWKKIAVPTVGNGELGLEMQDGNSSRKTAAVVTLDNNRNIRFGKAKMFGVHTGLGYEWNVMKALKGGCRVTLTWRRDRC